MSIQIQENRLFKSTELILIRENEFLIWEHNLSISDNGFPIREKNAQIEFTIEYLENLISVLFFFQFYGV